MDIDELFEKYDARQAIADTDKKWVYAKARPVDLTRERALAEDLGAILRRAIDVYEWQGVSSNNVFWTGTDTPVRMICTKTPDTKDYVILVNPEIREQGKIQFKSPDDMPEQCGSFPGKAFEVMRNEYVKIAGMLLDGQEIELEYRLTLDEILQYIHFKRGQMMTLEQQETIDKAAAVCMAQHEIDHLGGRVLPDIVLYSYSAMPD